VNPHQFCPFLLGKFGSVYWLTSSFKRIAIWWQKYGPASAWVMYSLLISSEAPLISPETSPQSITVLYLLDERVRLTMSCPNPYRYAKSEHKRAAHVLVCALTLGDHDAWFSASAIWMARLSAPERAALAFMALKAMTPDDALLTAESALMRGAGPPIAPLFGFMDEAAHWADMAELDELKAYALASFNRMPAPDQAAFLNFVHGEAAA
jgi:hypothetical protein